MLKNKVSSLAENIGSLVEENERLNEKIKKLTKQLLQHEIDASREVNWKDYKNLIEAKESAVMMWREALKEIARLTEKAKLADRYEVVIKDYENQFQTIGKNYSEVLHLKKEVDRKVLSITQEKKELQSIMAAKEKYIEVCEAKLEKAEEIYKNKYEEREKTHIVEKKALQDHIEELLGHIKSLKDKQKQLEEGQQQAQKLANDCLEKIQESTLQIAVLEQQKQKAEDEVKHLLEKSTKQNIESEEALKNAISNANTEIHNLKQAHKKEVKEIKEQLEAKCSEIKLAHKKIGELERQHLADASSDPYSTGMWQLKYKLQKSEEKVYHLEKMSRDQEQKNIEQEAYYKKSLQICSEKNESLQKELEETRLEKLEANKKLMLLDKTYQRHKSESKAMQKKMRGKIEKLEGILHEQNLKHAAILKKHEASSMTTQMNELIQNYDFIIKEMKRHMDSLIENIEAEYRKLFGNTMQLQEKNKKLASYFDDNSKHVFEAQQQLVQFSSQVDRLSQQLQDILKSQPAL